jgi:type I pantothenate kinase
MTWLAPNASVGCGTVATDPHAADQSSMYYEFSRHDWAELRQSMPMTLRREELGGLRGLGDVLSAGEVEEVFLPLARLISLYVRASADVHQVAGSFLGRKLTPIPFVIGIAGSVAVGKSTVSRVLRALLSRLPHRPVVDLVTTDGFLFPNAELERRDLMQRKGFPESYDLRALIGFLAAVRGGEPEVAVPVYSHLTYDLVPGMCQVVQAPDILIVEGLNVLQQTAASAGRTPTVRVSDFLDFTIYLDADAAHVRQWYIDRFLALRDGAFRDPASYFHKYSALRPDEAIGMASRIWDEINGPNLRYNISPTQSRARVILEKAEDHHVRHVRLRRF